MNRKQIISWCLFDFANSSYSAVIAAVIFPVYFTNVIVGNEGGRGDLWWGRAISLSMLFIAVTSPFLGGIADYAGLRKRLLFLYTAACVAAVAGFSLLSPGAIAVAVALAATANIGMEGGLVFYNSFLPRIAPPDHQGRVSSWGFGVGYAGSILALLIALPFAQARRFDAIWLMTAAYFGLASLPAFLFLPQDRAALTIREAGREGVLRAWRTIREIMSRRASRTFLISYLIYEDGVNTVIVFSSIFAATTLSFAPAELVTLYLVVQFSALAGAFLMARPMDFWGPRKVVMLSLLLWTVVSVAAFFVTEKNHFWAVAVVAGLGLGTVQAGSRAMYAQFIPPGREAEYFGVYSLVGKTSAVIGPIVFGEISSTFGSQRPAILSIAAFFLIGLMILSTVRGGGPTAER